MLIKPVSVTKKIDVSLYQHLKVSLLFALFLSLLTVDERIFALTIMIGCSTLVSRLLYLSDPTTCLKAAVVWVLVQHI
jgi:hypothetical protein